jgi:hypothetical protein
MMRVKLYKRDVCVCERAPLNEYNAVLSMRCFSASQSIRFTLDLVHFDSFAHPIASHYITFAPTGINMTSNIHYQLFNSDSLTNDFCAAKHRDC